MWNLYALELWVKKRYEKCTKYFHLSETYQNSCSRKTCKCDETFENCDYILICLKVLIEVNLS